MVGLVDIAPAHAVVKIGDSEVAVAGISAKGIAYLLGRFPELRMLLDGLGDKITPERMIEVGVEGVAAVIACGCGYPGDEMAENIAASLPVEAQMDLLEQIIKLTLPRGLGPFLERLGALTANLPAGAAQSSSEPATT